MKIGTGHPVRVLPSFGASDAPPGAVVFHRFLHDLNRTAPTTPGSDGRCAAPCPKVDRPHDFVELSQEALDASGSAGLTGTPLLPKLGEVLPTTPEPQARAVTEVAFVQRTPNSSGFLDITA